MMTRFFKHVTHVTGSSSVARGFLSDFSLPLWHENRALFFFGTLIIF